MFSGRRVTFFELLGNCPSVTPVQHATVDRRVVREKAGLQAGETAREPVEEEAGDGQRGGAGVGRARLALGYPTTVPPAPPREPHRGRRREVP